MANLNLDEVEWVGGESPTMPIDKKQRYVEFWRPLLKELDDRGEPNIKTRDNKKSYYDGPRLGVGGITRRMRLTKDDEARVEIWIRSPDKAWNKRVFDLLKESQADIEADMGVPLVWERADNNKGSSLGVSRGASIEDSPAHLDEIRRWMLEWVVKIREVFHPYLREATAKAGRK